MIIRRATTTNRLTLPLLMVIAAFGATHAGTVAPFLNEMARDLGVSKGLTGQLGTATYLAMMLSGVSVAPFVQRLPMRPVLVLGMIGLGVTSVLTGVIPWFGGLLFVRFLAGIAAVLVVAGPMAALGRAWPDPGARAKRQGFVMAAFAGGAGVTVPVLRVAAGVSSWQTALIGAGAVMGAVAIAGWALLPVMPGDRESAVLSVRERLGAMTRVPRMPVVGPVLILASMALASMACVLAYIAGFADDAYPNAGIWIGPMFTGFSAGFALGAALGGVLLNRLGGPIRVSTLGVLLQLAIVALFMWVTPSPAFTLTMLLIWGTLTGIYQNGNLSLLYEYSGDEQSTVMFTDRAARQLAGMVGLAVCGVAVDAFAGFVGWQVFITALSVMMLLPLAFVWRAVRRQDGLRDSG
jgi:predicted MFS family arabinose efflux permease